MYCLATRLNEARGQRVDELKSVLWAYRTTRTTTKETPYSLVYGSEELLPLELIILTNRTTNVEMDKKYYNLSSKLDVSMERSEVTAIRQEH